MIRFLYFALLISFSILSFQLGEMGLRDNIQIKRAIKRADERTRRDMAVEYISQDDILALDLPLIGEYSCEGDSWAESTAYYVLALDFLENGLVNYRFNKSIQENIVLYDANVDYEETLLAGGYRGEMAECAANILRQNRQRVVDNITAICSRIDQSLLPRYVK